MLCNLLMRTLKYFFFAHEKNKKVAYFMAHRHNGVVDTFGHILFHRNDSPWDLNLLTLVYALSTINIEFLIYHLMRKLLKKSQMLSNIYFS